MPRLTLNNTESLWFLLRNLIRFNAKKDSAIGKMTANETGLTINSSSAVTRADG
jgi:hypothetical protein